MCPSASLSLNEDQPLTYKHITVFTYSSSQVMNQPDKNDVKNCAQLSISPFKGTHAVRLGEITLNNNKRTQNQGIQHNDSTETRYFDRAVINAVTIRCYLDHLMTRYKTVEILMIFFIAMIYYFF